LEIYGFYLMQGTVPIRKRESAEGFAPAVKEALRLLAAADGNRKIPGESGKAACLGRF